MKSNQRASGILVVALASSLLLGGCVWYPRGWDTAADGPDPWQQTNRGVFGFNEGVDTYVVRPLAKGWEFITFEGMRVSIDKFFTNLGFPVRLISNLGQAEFKQAGTETGRFLVNTTVGLLGLFDPAAKMGLESSDEDIGQMFGRWGIGTGPYWVLPLFGPSNPRDGVGQIFDTVLNPAFWISRAVAMGTGGIRMVNRRAIVDPQVDAARQASLDFYIAVRDGFIERRSAQVANESFEQDAGAGAISDDLYDIDYYADDEPGEGETNAEP